MVHTLDPLADPRWEPFVQRHPDGSAFHTAGWLHALRETYGYEPVAFTTAAPGEELRDAVACCAVRSRLTGRRLVSLPFADHCDPLLESPAAWLELATALRERCRRDGLGYVEIRPALRPLALAEEMAPAETYAWHRLDLRPPEEALWRRLHRDCVRRKIRRAEREGLRLEEGRGPAEVDALHRLLALTRRRHGLPPAPRSWFRNLAAALGDDVTIRIARQDGRPVAGILTLRSGRGVLYKYGGSDPAFQQLGGMIALLWAAIRAARAEGAETFDLGRSDLDQPGLIAFKDRWGAERLALGYQRWPARRHAVRRHPGAARAVLARLPAGLLGVAGRLLYRHAG